MPSPLRRTPRTPGRAARLSAAGPATAGVVAATVLAGCATGLDAQTTQVYSAASGSDLRSSGVDALGTAVVVDASGEGTLVSGMVTSSEQTDALVGVTATTSSGDTLQTTIIDGRLDVPADTLTRLPEDGAVTLTGEGLDPGRVVSVVLTFRLSGDVTGDVPIVAREEEWASVPIPPEPSPTDGNGEGTGRTTAGRTTPGGAPEPTAPAD